MFRIPLWRRVVGVASSLEHSRNATALLDIGSCLNLPPTPLTSPFSIPKGRPSYFNCSIQLRLAEQQSAKDQCHEREVEVHFCRFSSSAVVFGFPNFASVHMPQSTSGTAETFTARTRNVSSFRRERLCHASCARGWLVESNQPFAGSGMPSCCGRIERRKDSASGAGEEKRIGGASAAEGHCRCRQRLLQQGSVPPSAAQQFHASLTLKQRQCLFARRWISEPSVAFVRKPHGAARRGVGVPLSTFRAR